MTTHLLAFIPLIDPLSALYPGMSDYWLWFVIPLLVAISIIYKGTRMSSLKTLPIDAAIMTFQILLFMTAAAATVGGLYWAMVHYL